MDTLNHSKKEISYLALGDSYTIGEGVSESERWPVQLTYALRQKGYTLNEPTIIAQTGWTTSELLAAIARSEPLGSFTLISLLIGVNNQYRGESLEKYCSEFEDLLQKAIRFAENKPHRVLVLSIPDWGVTPFARDRDRAEIHREIDRFNSCNRQVADKVGTAYIDITDISRRAAQEPELLAKDALHPSGKMYLLWVERILTMAKDTLRI